MNPVKLLMFALVAAAAGLAVWALISVAFAVSRNDAPQQPVSPSPSTGGVILSSPERK